MTAALQQAKLLAVHSLDVARHVHLLFGAVVAVGTLELRLLAALPFLMVAQRALQLVVAAAVGALDPLVPAGAGWRVAEGGAV